MSMNRGFTVLMAWAMMTALPAEVAAQPALPGLPVAVGQKVWITSADGRVTKGKVLTLTPATIELGKSDAPTANFEVADVRRIQVADSVRNGVVIGAISLGVAGLLAGSIVDAGDTAGDAFGFLIESLLGLPPQPVRSSHNYRTGALLGVVFGAALGYAIDDAKLKTVYQREDGGMSVSLRPLVAAAGKGVGVRVSW